MSKRILVVEDQPDMPRPRPPALSAFEQRLNSSDTYWVVRCYWSGWVWVYRPGMTRLPVTHKRGGF